MSNSFYTTLQLDPTNDYRDTFNRGTQRPNVSKYVKWLSLDFRSLLVWLIWSSRKNYLSVRMFEGNFDHLESFKWLFRPIPRNCSYPDGSGPEFGDILSLKDSRKRFSSIGDDF